MTILLVTALPAETRPLLDYFGLRPLALDALRAYTGERCLLVQTGMGKLCAASAVATVLAARNDIAAVVNVGLCGSAAPLGTVRLAHSVVDAGSGRRWYSHLPPRRIAPAVGSRRLVTHDLPATDYSADVLFDMEAAGIRAATAGRLDNTCVQCLKVVSDAPDAPLERFDRSRTGELIGLAIPVVDALLDWYTAATHDSAGRKRARDLDALLTDICADVRHSVSERHALRRLLERHHALIGDWPAPGSLALRSAKRLREELEATLAERKPMY